MSGDLQNRLRQLREHFSEQLSERLSEVDELWRSLSKKWDVETATDLRNIFHKLAGSGGTFGFDQLGTLCRELERLLDELLEQQADFKHNQPMMQTLISELGQAASGEDVQVPVAPYQSRQITPLASRPIFVVDDDPLQNEVICAALQEQEYEVISCEKLQQLKKGLESTLPGAIVMDIAFPEGPRAGSDLIASLQKEQVIQVPVIFISVHNNFDSRLEAVRAGGDAYFAKPINIADLVDKLDYLVAKGHSDSYRVLLVDDDVDLGEYHANVLRAADLQVMVITTPHEVLEVMADFRPELLLLDLHMPECSGIELANLLRQHSAYESIPIVFLSAEADAERHFEARLVGGDDFLVKPIEEEYLIAAVVNRVQRARSAEQRMTSDSMTGLVNHDCLLGSLKRQVALAARQNESLCFCMFDLDHFKSVNDNYGHMVGDAVIKNFASLLTQRLRCSDVIGRYGGEEFAVIMPNTSVTHAYELVEVLRWKFAKILHYWDEGTFTSTVSVGLASTEDFATSDELAKAADEALYRAKKEGRNQVCISSKSE